MNALPHGEDGVRDLIARRRWFELREAIGEHHLSLATHELLTSKPTKVIFFDIEKLAWFQKYIERLVSDHGDAALPILRRLLLQVDSD
jgi:hypothetical protein